MTYVIIITAAILLAACTLITVYVPPHEDGDDVTNLDAVSIQVSQPTNVVGSQNSDSSPKAARGDSTSNDSKSQKAESVNPITLAPTIPVGK